MRRVNMGRRLVVGLVLAGFAGCGVAARAEEPDEKNPYVWRPQTRSVAVFKNGLGFFMREGEVRLREGWCVAGEVPPAAFGTLAIYSRGEESVVDVVGAGPGEVVEFDGRDAPADVESKRARLEASLKLKVELSFEHRGLDRTAAGKLVSVGPDFVVLEDEAGNIAVPLEAITKMQILELPLRIHVAGEAEEPVEQETLGMAYLRKGITWIPDYTLKVLDDDTAELTLRGTIVNQAEDLIHTDVHLVVGVPHFVHTDYLAPIAVGQRIRTIGTAIESQEEREVPQQVTTQIMSRAAIVQNVAPRAVEAPVVEEPVEQPDDRLERALGDLPQFEGPAATDYKVYTKENLTLRRGEKAIVTLFTRKISFSHIYHWSPPERMTHSLVLHNTTDTPWTTGPCLVMSDGQPLSEDLLKYTPRGARGEVPVTAAVNIAHSRSERETDRELNAHQVRTTVYFDLVTLDGELKLHNYEGRTVEIVIRNPVSGKPVAASDDGTVQTDPTKLKLDEREGTVTWRIKLEPGERKTLTYQYERYVRAN